jgi:hypothetical protein
MKMQIWRVLLAESQELVDELLDRGDEAPAPGDVVDCVLATHRFVRGIERYREPLGEEVAAYLESCRPEPIESAG